ncbi:MAG TPA: putative leader peptide [Pseudonocardiaceae bacterium]|nr:putative leader peptide [Pseudonocardiaceae bacterium]
MSRPAGAVSVERMLAQAWLRLRRLAPAQTYVSILAACTGPYEGMALGRVYEVLRCPGSRNVRARRVRLEGIRMFAPGMVGRAMAVGRQDAASRGAHHAVFVTVWLVMRRHVDLLRLASAMCQA